VRISTPSGDTIEAWVYRPYGDGPHPAVVMAHGIGAVRYIPNSAGPGQVAVGATEDALYGLGLMTPREPADFHNRVAARSLLSVAAHRPVRRAAAIRCPILLIVAQEDTMAPTGPALRVANTAPRAELYRSRGGHYDVYQGGIDHDNVLRTEVEFLHRHTGSSPA
jgi:dienelactone hydrolase